MRKNPFVLLAFVACVVASLSNGCDLSPKEGDPCNALIAHDECSDGLVCQTIGSCTTAYCCPANASSSKNDLCNGNSCPPLPPDAGDEAGDAASE